ncbi:VWA domain-containing protein [Thermodesulfobacteriota bacterium]
MTDLKIAITPHRKALLAGHDNELDVLVRVKAPPPSNDLPKRQPLNLSLVIDRSGSMHGQPLEEAKRCALMIVDSLDSEDLVSLVTYDNRTTIDVASRKVGDRRSLHLAINAINAGGTTALYDGWYQGAGQASQGVEQASMSRVLLLSDGRANSGLTDPLQIEQYCASMAEVGVTTSTYGLSQHFNEELMVQMARAGLGNSYYGQTAEDLMDPFREEFELLQNLCARRLRLSLETPSEITVKVLNGYPSDEDGSWRLPDLAYGGEAWAAVRLRIPYSAEQVKQEILKASVVFETLDGSVQSLEPEVIALPWLPQEAYLAVATDPLVAERVGELQAADLQDQARVAARRGDWKRVDALLSRARREAENNPWLRESLEVLKKYAAQRESEFLAKEVKFSSAKLRNRLADANEGVGNYQENLESSKAAYLRRKREQGKKF